MGRAYKDVLELPPPGDAAEGGHQGDLAGVGESGAAVFITGFSKDTLQYIDYVPRLVPRGTQSSRKRVRWIVLPPVLLFQRSLVE